ncbi:hypothetical protein BASA81_018562 [Batrachochytrium salamandrivorans]|nr:hypothetical protein BASA81_018562 [Batrachochytrium salamandrivorans]
MCIDWFTSTGVWHILFRNDAQTSDRCHYTQDVPLPSSALASMVCFRCFLQHCRKMGITGHTHVNGRALSAPQVMSRIMDLQLHLASTREILLFIVQGSMVHGQHCPTM